MAKELKIPAELIWDARLPEADKKLVADLNASLALLDGLRAVKINVSGHFARSKIAWKLAAYQHVLLHRIVALADGLAIAWNNGNPLSAMLCARALMETIAVMTEFGNRAVKFLAKEDLGALDGLAQNGIFATRDPELTKEAPEITATSVLTFIDKFDKLIPGFRGHYDSLSERCHPNAAGHNFMFSKLDRADGSIEFMDERDPDRNAQLVIAALIPLPLIESLMTRLDDAVLKVSDLQHKVAPVPDQAL